MYMFRSVWLLRNWSLDGKLCLCDGKNAAFLSVHNLSTLQASMDAHKPQVVSDWLNPPTLSGDHVSRYIKNLA